MQRINIYFDETMLDHLKALPGTVAEHIRQATYEYLLRKSVEKVSSSASAKGGK